MANIFEQLYRKSKTYSEQIFFQTLQNEFSNFSLKIIQDCEDSHLSEKQTQMRTANEDVENLTQSLTQTRERLTETQNTHQKAQNDIQDEVAQLETLQKTLNQQVTELSEKVAEAVRQASKGSRFLKPYTSGLELDLDITEDNLYKINLKQSSQERLVTIHVRVSEDGSYEITSCEPHVNGLDALMAELKTTNSINTFLAKIHSLP